MAADVFARPFRAGCSVNAAVLAVRGIYRRRGRPGSRIRARGLTRHDSHYRRKKRGGFLEDLFDF
jgi:Zn-finger nucleic acid-binding protein